ncbi:MAG: sensor histidine kinase [Bacillota bacterium]
MDLLTIMNEIVFAAVEGLIIILIYSILSNHRRFCFDNKLKTLVFIVFYVIFSYWATMYLPLGYHTLAIVVSASISLGVISGISLWRAFITMIIVAIFVMATEGIFVLGITSLMKINISEIIDSPINKLFLSLGVKTFEVLLIILGFRINKSFFKNMTTDANGNIVSYFLLGIFLIGVLTFSTTYVINEKVNLILYEALILGIFLIFICIGGIVYRDMIKLWKIQQKYKLQEEYIRNIEEIIGIIRREKHDFSNHINTVYALCMLNKEDTIERIKTYLDKLTHNLHSSYHYYNTGDDYFDGLLAVKSNYAFTHNIHMDVEFEEPLNRLSVDSYDLIGIISNIIDNGFDALLAQSENDQKIMSIYTYIEDNVFYLSIANNGPSIPQDYIEKIFENGFSTKNENKEEHGLGLFITKKLVEKNNGKILVKSSEEETEFLIAFKIKEINHGDTSKEDYALYKI